MKDGPNNERRFDKNVGTFLQYGISEDLADRAIASRLTISKVRALTLAEIEERGFRENEARELKSSLQRKPIDKDDLFRLLENSNFLCCVCKGVKGKSIIVHHIEPYATSQDNRYENLIVLCPNDHDLAHRDEGNLSLSLSVKDLQKSKANWEQEVRLANAKNAIRIDQRKERSLETLSPSTTIGFNGDYADIVASTLAVARVMGEGKTIDVEWSRDLIEALNLLPKLLEAAENYADPFSPFHGADPLHVARFVSSGPTSLGKAKAIIAGAADRAEMLIKGMSNYWDWKILDHIIATALGNFLILANFQARQAMLGALSDFHYQQNIVPTKFQQDRTFLPLNKGYQKLFSLDEPVATAKLTMLSGRDLPGVWFWGPEREVMGSLKWRDGEAVSGTWIDRFLIPQNEFRLIGSFERFGYNETLKINKVVDHEGREHR